MNEMRRKSLSAPMIAGIISFLFFGIFSWMAFDRKPPLVLYDGKIIPSIVYPGQKNVEVVWRARFSGRDCPGYTQRELIDSGHNLWPKRKRARGGVFHPDRNGSLVGTVTTPPLSIPMRIAPGRAYYRVTQFYYCNALQRWFRWPIVQPSVKIPFTVAAGD